MPTSRMFKLLVITTYSHHNLGDVSSMNMLSFHATSCDTADIGHNNFRVIQRFFRI